MILNLMENFILLRNLFMKTRITSKRTMLICTAADLNLIRFKIMKTLPTVTHSR